MNRIVGFLSKWKMVILEAAITSIIQIFGLGLFFYALTNFILYFKGAPVSLFDQVCLMGLSIILQWKAVNHTDDHMKNYIWKQIKKYEKSCSKTNQESGGQNDLECVE